MPNKGENGIALLPLNTNREPDRDRGKDIKHFELLIPAHIKEEFDKWDKGSRVIFSPKEAAKMLWRTDVASHLDGRFDAWKEIPGIQLLLPGWQKIENIKQEELPENLDKLKEMVAKAASLGVSTQGFIDRLNRINAEMGVESALNDLVLLFKYAAVGSERPINLVANLYRLVRTILTDNQGAPNTRKSIHDWLTAPLIAPSLFTKPLDLSGPRSQLADDTGNNPNLPVNPLIPRRIIDKASVEYLKLVRNLENDLEIIEKVENEKDALRIIRNIEPEHSELLAKIERNINSVSDNSNVETRIFRKRKLDSINTSNRVITRNLGGFPLRINTDAIKRRDEIRNREMTTMVLNSLPNDLRARIHAINKDTYDFNWGWIDGFLKSTTETQPSYLEPVGRTDLLIVRQITTGYRRAEISHVENILIGENRRRAHIKNTLTRDEIFESNEEESEETSDLQTTDRSEINNEINEVLNEDKRIEGSVEATYRGATKIVAKAAGSFESTMENAAKTATNYATEIIDRAQTRVLLRKKREIKSLLETDLSEENHHEFLRANNAGDHVSGVYQYLERVSRAKIFSYGERDLFDILVPEPAALIWNLVIPGEDDEDEIEAPDHDLFDSLTLNNIESKLFEVIKAFKVVNIPDLLENTLYPSFPFADKDKSGHGDNVYIMSKSVRIEDGYHVTGATFTASGQNEGNKDIGGGVTIGPVSKSWDIKMDGGVRNTIEGGPLGFTFSPKLSAPELGIAIDVENYNTIEGSITLTLELSDEKLREWQIKAYAAVAERYGEMKKDYELALIREEALQPEEDITLPVGARRRLNKIIRNELQRAAIGMMRNTPVEYDLVNDVAPQGPPFPTTNIPELKSKETEIRFLQQAFEWEHLSWILYPYFWGRRDGTPGWANTILQDHPDPDFAEFLNAGAARLQISVRPGFEDSVKHFMETGEAYEGGGLPKMGDTDYMSFIDEQINSLGGPGEEVPWPPNNPIEWDIVTPTPLILVRKTQMAELPKWDRVTGDEVE